MSGYRCVIGDDDNPVVVLVTSLVSGQTLASCADDLPLLMIGQLATTLAVDPQRLYDAIQRFTDREAKSAAKAAAAAAEPDSGQGESITVTPSSEMRAAVLNAAGLDDTSGQDTEGTEQE
jgi:hypothetical protein